MGADIKAFISNNDIPFLAKPFRMNELEETIENILAANWIMTKACHVAKWIYNVKQYKFTADLTKSVLLNETGAICCS